MKSFLVVLAFVVGWIWFGVTHTAPTPVGPEVGKPAPFMVAPADSEASRFTVRFVSAFHDALAYRDERGVYVITDTKTGQEFVGVSGIGISELGSHTSMAGKTPISVPDER